jgi:hypothetical protein
MPSFWQADKGDGVVKSALSDLPKAGDVPYFAAHAVHHHRVSRS